MSLCPKCNKWELEEGEKYCLSGSNKRSNVIVKAGEAVVAVAIIVIVVLLGKKKE